MLDTHQLNVFLVAAQTLNFTQAAMRLHMTQPSVSQHIQAMERHFGVPLFVRAGRNIELTDAGLRLLPMARDLVTRSIQIEETMESLKGEVYGHLHVGCSTTPGKYVLPQLLAHFHRDHPKVRVTCQVTSQHEALRMLVENEIHVALTSMPKEVFKEAEFKKFMTDPICLIAPLDHPWAARGSIEPEELINADFILRESTSGTLIAMREALDSVGVSISDLRVILTLGNSEAIAMAVQEGLGVGFVSSMVINRLVSGKVALVNIRDLQVSREIYIGRYINRPATSAQTAFWEFINREDHPIYEELIRPMIELLPA